MLAVELGQIQLKIQDRKLMMNTAPRISGYPGVFNIKQLILWSDYSHYFLKLISEHAIAIQTITTASPDIETSTRYTVDESTTMEISSKIPPLMIRTNAIMDTFYSRSN